MASKNTYEAHDVGYATVPRPASVAREERPPLTRAAIVEDDYPSNCRGDLQGTASSQSQGLAGAVCLLRGVGDLMSEFRASDGNMYRYATHSSSHGP